MDRIEKATAKVAFGVKGMWAWLELDDFLRNEIETAGAFDVEPPDPQPEESDVYRMECDVEWESEPGEYGETLSEYPVLVNGRYVPLALLQKQAPPILHERDESGNWICCCGDHLACEGEAEPVGWMGEADWSDGRGWVGPENLRIFDTADECFEDLNRHVHVDEGRVRFRPLIGGEWTYPQADSAGFTYATEEDHD